MQLNTVKSIPGIPHNRVMARQVVACSRGSTPTPAVRYMNGRVSDREGSHKSSKAIQQRATQPVKRRKHLQLVRKVAKWWSDKSRRNAWRLQSPSPIRRQPPIRCRSGTLLSLLLLLLLLLLWLLWLLGVRRGSDLTHPTPNPTHATERASHGIRHDVTRPLRRHHHVRHHRWSSISDRRVSTAMRRHLLLLLHPTPSTTMTDRWHVSTWRRRRTHVCTRRCPRHASTWRRRKHVRTSRSLLLLLLLVLWGHLAIILRHVLRPLGMQLLLLVQLLCRQAAHACCLRHQATTTSSRNTAPAPATAAAPLLLITTTTTTIGSPGAPPLLLLLLLQRHCSYMRLLLLLLLM